jgi:tRNA uridine 5-carboxymethylaminomethyl modification enzyme
MFTSRAEYRLSLRQDNADLRLTRRGFDIGIISEERKKYLIERYNEVERCMNILQNINISRQEWSKIGSIQISQKDGKYKTAIDVLSMPDMTLKEMINIIKEIGIRNNDSILSSFEVKDYAYHTVEATCKYSNYLSRQELEMSKWKKNTLMNIPSNLEYIRENFPSFSTEELENLNKYKPNTLHSASQIQGNIIVVINIIIL